MSKTRNLVLFHGPQKLARVTLNSSFEFASDKVELIDNPNLYIDAMNEIGMPLIFNPTKSEDGSDDFPYFDFSFGEVGFHVLACLRAIHEIYGTIHGQLGCKLYDYCVKAEVNVDEVICNSTPWEMVKKHPCPYAQLWHLFGFPSQVKTV